jgi:photosystem II stability/assembly factor-like uncharacterized protein
VADKLELESLYREAQSALKGRDYARASELLRQILHIDENYKDTSRLLAQMVKLRRRRWYSHPLLWVTIGLTALIALYIFIAPRVQELYASQIPSPMVPPTATLLTAIIPTILPPTATVVPLPTPVPLVWKRISLGQEFTRDEITAIQQDPTDNQAGIFKSIDGGLSWRPMSVGLDSAHIGSLLVSPIDHNTVFAYTGSGLYISSNGGADWQLVGERGFSSEGFVEADSRGNIYYVWGESHIRRSEDGGQTWVDVGSIPDSIRSFVISPTNPDTFYAASWKKLYRSSDAGKSWASINPGWTNTNIESTDVSATGKYIYVASRGYPDGPLSHILDAASGQWKEMKFPAGCSVFADPLHDEVAYCGVEKSIFKTSDAGKSWQLLGNLNVDFVKEILPSSYDPKIMYAGGKGLFVSSDGGQTWTRGNGLPGVSIELKIDPKNSSILYVQDVATSGNPIFRSTDTGQTWMHFRTDTCSLMFDADGNLVCGYSRSRNGGATWVGMDWLQRSWGGVIGANYPQSPVMLQALGGEEIDQRYFVKLFTSQDKGISWERVTLQTDWEWGGSLRFYFDHERGQVIYALDVRGVRALAAHHSNDFGKTWQDCPSSEVSTSKTDSRLAIDYRDSNYLILASQGEGILISKDGCASWRSSNIGLSSLFVNTIAIDPNNPDIIYAGTDGGAYVSFNRGQTWDEIRDGRPWGEINDGLLGALVIYSIVVDNDSNVYAATPYGIFKLEGK